MLRCCGVKQTVLVERDEMGHCQVEIGVPYCATRNPRRRMRAPLTIPVSGLLIRWGVDVGQITCL